MKNRGAALVTVIVFIILISMVAVTSIYLMTNQARLVEKQIRRITAFYSCQAAQVQAIDDIYQDGSLGDTDLDINNQSATITPPDSTSVPPGEFQTSVIYFP